MQGTPTTDEREQSTLHAGTDEPVVLLVDDEESNLGYYQACLEEDGYKLVMARDGIEAEEVMAGTTPDVVVLDIRMPRRDGFRTCRWMRSRDETKHVPVLFVTALGDEESVQEGIRCGADDFVSKPVKPNDLRVRVKSLLQIRGCEDELMRVLNYIRILGHESEPKDR
jgi:putative two-component system response regulator